ncbi:hypothetical protein ACFV0L_21300, partial [Streptosporangium canum]
DACTTLKANLRAGNLGPPGSRRRTRAESKPIAFRPHAAQPYDDRCLSWRIEARTVSIWTVRGRLRGVAFTASAAQLKTLALYRKGESDLLCRDGMWFLIATCDLPEVPLTAPDGFTGVDLGIVNIATTGDGARHSGKGLNAVRHRRRELRRRLQAKATRSAKRLLKKRRRAEARFAPPAEADDVFGGELVIGHRAAGVERCDADKEVVIDHSVIAHRVSRLDDLLVPDMRWVGVDGQSYLLVQFPA